MGEPENAERRTVRPLRSVHGIIESPVRFVNLTGRQVDVIWINYQGEEALQATLKTNRRLDLNTFMTHPWIAVDSKTNERMLLNFRETYFPAQPEIRRMDFERRKAYAVRAKVNITLPGKLGYSETNGLGQSLFSPPPPTLKNVKMLNLCVQKAIDSGRERDSGNGNLFSEYRFI